MEAPVTEAEFKSKSVKELTDILFNKTEEDYKDRLNLLKITHSQS